MMKVFNWKNQGYYPPGRSILAYQPRTKYPPIPEIEEGNFAMELYLQSIVKAIAQADSKGFKWKLEHNYRNFGDISASATAEVELKRVLLE
ncbi:MAG: hypothetical protein AAGG02_01100 [Cyanobacteria bacterium P01_H01_bin.15]